MDLCEFELGWSNAASSRNWGYSKTSSKKRRRRKRKRRRRKEIHTQTEKMLKEAKEKYHHKENASIKLAVNHPVENEAQ